MKAFKKKNIIFLSDENTPYVNEFALLSDEEIADLVERRLFSNNYFNYTIYSIHKSNGNIVLIRDDCKHKVETTLSKIEDGLIYEKCTECRQAEKVKLRAFKDNIQDELKERGLIVVLFETEENTDSMYIECIKCGAKHYLDIDFSLNDEAWEMYCKNWDCMMDVNNWFANEVKLRKIIIKDNSYSPKYVPFIQDDQDWYESLKESDGYYEYKCDKCSAINVLPFGSYHECRACLENGENDAHWDGWCESGIVKMWDEIEDQVTIQCEKCGNTYQVSCEDTEEGAFGCFECYKRNSSNEKICPVCDAEHTENAHFCTICGFPVSEFRKDTINTQSQYIDWLKNTVRPCWRIWSNVSLKNNQIQNNTSELSKKDLKLRMYECAGETKKGKILAMALDELDLSLRAYNCLKKAGIETLGDLIMKTYDEVKMIKNLGKRQLDEIVDKLKSLGIFLKNSN